MGWGGAGAEGKSLEFNPPLRHQSVRSRVCSGPPGSAVSSHSTVPAMFLLIEKMSVSCIYPFWAHLIPSVFYSHQIHYPKHSYICLVGDAFRLALFTLRRRILWQHQMHSETSPMEPLGMVNPSYRHLRSDLLHRCLAWSLNPGSPPQPQFYIYDRVFPTVTKHSPVLKQPKAFSFFS